MNSHLLELHGYEGRANGLRYLRWGCGRRSRPARKMIRREKRLEIAAESPASGARFVGTLLVCNVTRISELVHNELLFQMQVRLLIVNMRSAILLLLEYQILFYRPT